MAAASSSRPFVRQECQNVKWEMIMFEKELECDGQGPDSDKVSGGSEKVLGEHDGDKPMDARDAPLLVAGRTQSPNPGLEIRTGATDDAMRVKRHYEN